jgi:hypothetical protein
MNFTLVACYWEYNENHNNYRSKVWDLKHTVPLDGDGEVIWRKDPDINDFMYNKHEDGSIDYDDPIPGRMITIWSFEFGVSLHKFHPLPTGWLEVSAPLDMCKLSKPFRLINGGLFVQGATANEAQRLIEESFKPKRKKK